MSEIDIIRKRVEKGDVTLGTKETLLNLKLGNLEAVYITSNCPKSVLEDIKQSAGSTKLVELQVTNQELGVLCKKPFFISIMGFLKQK
ncbi:ribosomal L7Ae/L30e/S12e/Gadd45 family protein [Candidatus Woesearchaeota archaeon]|nr:ribosomal L7Ae/L30e/S12e/Gadd45 family protein [Candidatus Woesearchaeota archaeon]MBW3016751.1 ribosomal L7Ae/L30e/S12e/Gadd45 family protein [Candidatus Woesearchaeota archaeon]